MILFTISLLIHFLFVLRADAASLRVDSLPAKSTAKKGFNTDKKNIYQTFVEVIPADRLENLHIGPDHKKNGADKEHRRATAPSLSDSSGNPLDASSAALPLDDISAPVDYVPLAEDILAVSITPSWVPVKSPTVSTTPSLVPSATSSDSPTSVLSNSPTILPSIQPNALPSSIPSFTRTLQPTMNDTSVVHAKFSLNIKIPCCQDKEELSDKEEFTSKEELTRDYPKCDNGKGLLGIFEEHMLGFYKKKKTTSLYGC